MAKWLSRGLVFAALMVVVRLVHGTLINQFATQAVTISLSLCAVVVVLAFLWGWVDGRADARANPDPDRRADLAMTWLLAGLIAGLIAGPVSWLISLAYKPVYTGGLISELTTFAAFTALLVFLPAVLGVAIGRWLTDRNAPAAVRHGHAHDNGDFDRADTDVFAAVRDETAGDTADVAEPQRAE